MSILRMVMGFAPNATRIPNSEVRRATALARSSESVLCRNAIYVVDKHLDWSLPMLELEAEPIHRRKQQTPSDSNAAGNSAPGAVATVEAPGNGRSRVI
jgi:hypothetical protein